MNKKTTWISVIALVIVAVVIAAVWLNAKPAKAPEVGSTASSTSPAVTSTAPAASTTPTSTVTVTMGDSYANADYSFDYPGGWTISSYRPFVLSTFGGKYLSGGAVPAGGAEFDISTTTVYGNLQSIMQSELSSSKDLATAAITVDKTSCAKATYGATIAGVAMKDSAVYCAKGNKLWKMYFSYRADDAKGSVHEADFASILASLKLL